MICYRVLVITFEISNCTKEKLNSYSVHCSKNIIHNAKIVCSVPNMDYDKSIGYVNQLMFVPLVDLITNHHIGLNQIKSMFNNYMKEHKINDMEIVRINYLSETA